MKIYGYSKGTGVGILMTGTLKGRVLDIAIPVLSYDSAIANFNLEFPGPSRNWSDISVSTQGHNPNYVQALCSSSPLVTNAVFELGTRDPATGADTSPTTTKTAPTSNEACSGKAGKAKVSAKVSKKPNAVKNGKKGAFKITVKNSGTASAKNVVITAPGAKVKGGKIAPGKSKTYNVKAKVKGKKGKKVTVKFTIKGKGVSAKATAKVKVK